jgi:hypothetical protein
LTEPDEVMLRVGHGIELGQAGERSAARMVFAELWQQIGEEGDPLHRCAVAHSFADVQDDPNDELVWDLRALQAAELITDDRAQAAGIASPVAAFYPSLHLNLGEVYRKLGDLDLARLHLEQGQATAAALGEDLYDHVVKAGLDALAQRLSPPQQPRDRD